jgi:outer membrane protein assembly factor BamA
MKHGFTYYFFFGFGMILFYLSAGITKMDAQKSFEVKLNAIELLEDLTIVPPKKATDSLDLILQFRKTLRQLNDKGYLAASINKIERFDSSFHVNLEPGAQYTWLRIDPGNVPAAFLESSGFNPVLLKKKAIYFPELSAIMHSIIDVYANNGHPFARIHLDSIEIRDNMVSAKLNLTKNKIFRFDSISIISTEQISSKYLENLLGIQKGKLYDQSKISAIPSKLKSVTFLQIEESPIIQFKGNSVIVQLNLKAKKNSRFDILIGILPDNKAANKVRITGDIQAELYNKLGQGEFASLRYKSNSAIKQELSLDLDYPYLFNLPFGINSAFKLYRNAEENRDIDFDFGVQYRFANFRNFKLFWKNTSSRLIGVDTEKIILEQRLPANLDVQLNAIGLAFETNTLNYVFNPRSGFKMKIEGTGGLKEVIPNLEILSLKTEQLDFSNSYDTLRSGYQFSLQTYYAHYLPVGNLIAVKLANASGIKIAEYALYLNESFRIGGSKLLRGFDEESIYARSYSVFTLESRLLISTNSYFFIFGDYGFIQRTLALNKLWDRTYGLGAGLSFDTGSGILLVSAAVGSQMQQALDFNSSKIHLGYVSLF